ncbi:ser/Thr protein phosphatase family protein [Corynespora cassiicola Philippines]|uniref:Ser/Thr protein phosphatase family protein n=1 Tax=Corynespora cassiicola Philippines TaxID=1448308 RepID=A0A2T2N784_CORCC|nr:ser/Thr protein phosphatase family protein [Corynespora cassiicola Philippines]
MSTLSSSSPIKTRFLVISDTHNASPVQNATSADTAFRPPLPKADVLLHCGDLTMVGRYSEYEATLEMLASIDADLKLVIAGNHDISLDEAYYRRKGQSMQRLNQADESLPARARELWTGELAKAAGVTFLDEGTYSFVLKNGAKLRVYASPYQPEFCDWAFPYWRNEDRYNPPHLSTPLSVPIASNPVPDFPAIDLMMTHGPPHGILDATTHGEPVGCEHLLRAARRCRPRMHCFGHIHEGWGAEHVQWSEGELGDTKEGHIQQSERVQVDEQKAVSQHGVLLDMSSTSTPLAFGKETLMVNASIMTVRYRPAQAPWVVDLDLEPADPEI